MKTRRCNRLEKYLKTEEEKWKEYAESQAKPTCVVDEQPEKQLQCAVQPVAPFDWKTPVYLTSQQGFDNYCKGCEKLTKTEKIASVIRVFCSAEKCVK